MTTTMNDLLEALEAIIEFANNGTGINPGSLVLDDARQAIARAREIRSGKDNRTIQLGRLRRSIHGVTEALCHQRSALVGEISTLKSLIEPEGTGHFHTTIWVLEWRIGQIDSQIEVLGDTE